MDHGNGTRKEAQKLDTEEKALITISIATVVALVLAWMLLG